MQKLRSYSWPGNVREMENVLQRALVMARGDIITLEHLPLALGAEGDLVPRNLPWQEGVPMKKIVADVEKELILRALQQTGGNQTRAAQMLRINRRQLFEKMKRLRINARAKRER